MLNAKVDVKVKDNMKKMAQLVKDLSELEILVGIPEAKSSRKTDEVNNAQLLYIHTHGSPLNNIPPRPVVEAAIEYPKNKEEIAQEVGKVAPLILNGDRQKAKDQMKVAGQLAQNLVRDWFTNPANGWPPLAPSTIEKRARKTIKISRYKTEATKQKYRVRLGALMAFGVFNPLIDTAQLRKSIVYVIRKKGSSPVEIKLEGSGV